MKMATIMTTTLDWQRWLTQEINFPPSKILLDNEQRILRRWLVSRVSTDEVDEAVDVAAKNGDDLHDLVIINHLIADQRRRQIQEIQ